MQTGFAGILQRIRAAAGRADAVGHANSTVVNHKTVAALHTAAGVMFGGVNHFVRAVQDVFISVD